MTNFEIKKLIKNKAAVGGFAASLLIFFGMMYISFYDVTRDGQHSNVHGRELVALNNKVANDHAGTLTDERVRNVIYDYAKNRNDTKEFMDVFSWYVTDKFLISKDVLYSTNKKEKINLSKLKIKSVNDLDTKVSPSKLKLGNFAAWDGIIHLVNMSFILIVVLSIYLCSGVFAGEKDKKIEPLLLTTKYGRSKLSKSKFIAVFTISTIVFIVFQLLALICFAGYIGLDGWDTSVQLNFLQDLIKLPVSLNLFQFYLLTILIQYIGLIFLISSVCLVSNFSQTTVTTLSISLFVFILPRLLFEIFKNGLGYRLLTFFPIINGNLVSISENIGKSPYYPTLTLISVFMIITSVGFCYRVYLNVKKKDV